MFVVLTEGAATKVRIRQRRTTLGAIQSHLALWRAPLLRPDIVIWRWRQLWAPLLRAPVHIRRQALPISCRTRELRIWTGATGAGLEIGLTMFVFSTNPHRACSGLSNVRSRRPPMSSS